jgi:hypothetical protein
MIFTILFSMSLQGLIKQRKRIEEEFPGLFKFNWIFTRDEQREKKS